MSLLMDHGHPDAIHYPIARVYDEARLVTERQNRELVTMGVIVQAATATTGMTAGQKAADHFGDLIKKLSGDG